MNATLAIVETVHTEDSTGRGLIQFRPVLTPDCTASGTLSFAVWQMYADEPETHEPARQSALANARKVMSELAKA